MSDEEFQARCDAKTEMIIEKGRAMERKIAPLPFNRTAWTLTLLTEDIVRLEMRIEALERKLAQ